MKMLSEALHASQHVIVKCLHNQTSLRTTTRSAQTLFRLSQIRLQHTDNADNMKMIRKTIWKHVNNVRHISCHWQLWIHHNSNNIIRCCSIIFLLWHTLTRNITSLLTHYFAYIWRTQWSSATHKASD